MLSECDCSLTQITKDFIDFTYGTANLIYSNSTPLINSTSFKVRVNGQANYVQIDIARINTLPDSNSLVCGNAPDGTKFCNLKRTPVILNSNGNEIDLFTSSLFKLNTVSGVLTI